MYLDSESTEGCLGCISSRSLLLPSRSLLPLHGVSYDTALARVPVVVGLFCPHTRSHMPMTRRGFCW